MAGRIFILSPANCSGKRAQQLLRSDAGGGMATGLRSDAGVPLGDLFAYISGLYFRGKLAYATHFASPPRTHASSADGVQIITPADGLRAPDTVARLDDVRRFANQSIDVANAAYRLSLETSARSLDAALGDCEVVLLGSIASPKYVEILLSVFGQRLLFPSDFVGRGDMSRGGLLLRQVAAGIELPYVPVAGTERRGVRPPKLPPLPGAATVASAARKTDAAPTRVRTVTKTVSGDTVRSPRRRQR